MASSNKTEHLHLNAWSGTDKPTRSDFVNDNRIIDSAVSGHVSDSQLHLTADEKQRISQPFTVKILQGTDEAQRKIPLDFTPSFVLYFTTDKPYVLQENGVQTVYACISAYGFGASSSCAIGTNAFFVNHTTEGEVVYKLNSKKCQYVMIAVR